MAVAVAFSLALHVHTIGAMGLTLLLETTKKTVTDRKVHLTN